MSAFGCLRPAAEFIALGLQRPDLALALFQLTCLVTGTKGNKIRPTRTKETKLGVLNSQKPSARPWMLGH